MCGLLKGMIEKIFKSGLTLNYMVEQGLISVPVTCREKLFSLIKSGIYNTRPNHKSQYLIHMNTPREMGCLRSLVIWADEAVKCNQCNVIIDD